MDEGKSTAVIPNLYELLCNWNLQHLYNHFTEHRITIDIIKILKPKHIDLLFNGIAVGDLATFEEKLELWKNTVTTTNTPPKQQQNDLLKPPISSVLTMLNETKNGQLILKYYQQNKNLHEEQRQLLIKTIANFVETKGWGCSIKDCSDMEKEICKIFPTEELEYYTSGKRGKIYNKIYNLKRFSKSILFKESPRDENYIESIDDSDVNLALQCLRSENTTADEFDIYWRKCAKYRFQQMADSKSTADILKQWPEYLKPSGFQLIEIDFSLKYNDAKDLKLKWPCYEKKLFHILKTKVNYASVSKKMLELTSSDEESKIFGIMWFLHHLLPPQQKVMTDESGSKIRKKFSIQDSQESFAIVASTEEELTIKLNLLKVLNLNIQPRLLIIGNILKIEKIFIYFDEIQYPMLKIITAVDLLFKIFFVFSLEFPQESIIFYNFLQIFFYEIPSEKKFAKVHTLKNDILCVNDI